jgi:hypothetical protein
MAYKGRFRPSQVLGLDSRFRPSQVLGLDSRWRAFEG